MKVDTGIYHHVLSAYQIWLFYAGVILERELSHRMVSTEEKLTFRARLTQRLAGQGTVKYKLYRSDREDPTTGGPKFESNFDTAGRYLKISYNHVSFNGEFTTDMGLSVTWDILNCKVSKVKSHPKCSNDMHSCQIFLDYHCYQQNSINLCTDQFIFSDREEGKLAISQIWFFKLPCLEIVLLNSEVHVATEWCNLVTRSMLTQYSLLSSCNPLPAIGCGRLLEIWLNALWHITTAATTTDAATIVNNNSLFVPEKGWNRTEITMYFTEVDLITSVMTVHVKEL